MLIESPIGSRTTATKGKDRNRVDGQANVSKRGRKTIRNTGNGGEVRHNEGMVGAYTGGICDADTAGNVGGRCVRPACLGVGGVGSRLCFWWLDLACAGEEAVRRWRG